MIIDNIFVKQKQSLPATHFFQHKPAEINQILLHLDRMIMENNLHTESWNGRQKLLTSIPTKSNQRQFDRWANSTSGFLDIVKQLLGNETNQDGSTKAISLIVGYIACKFPVVY